MYVKWFETVMFYYVILVYYKKSFFKNFKFPAGSAARNVPTSHRDRNTEARCRHPPEEMDGDAAGDP
ncbi:unnamed protein product, partial [Staurois parvus]